MATISRLLKIAGLFCNRALQTIFCKETSNLKEPTTHSQHIDLRAHPASLFRVICVLLVLLPCACHAQEAHYCHTERCCGEEGVEVGEEEGHLVVGEKERWGAGVEYHFQEFNENYAPS